MAKKAASKTTKPKRKVSGRRGSPGRKTYKSETDPRGVIGIAVLCLGILMLAVQFIPSSGGFLNQCMLIVRGLGGTLCLLLPIMICWLGVMLVFFKDNRVSKRTLICGLLLFLFVETMFQLFQVNLIQSALIADKQAVNYLGFLTRSYTYDSFSCTGGGFIGALLAWPLYKALDVWGAIIVLVFACTMVLMVLTGVSFAEVGMNLSEWLDDLRVRLKEGREEREAAQRAAEEEALEEERALAAEREKRRAERARQQKAEAKAAKLEEEAQAEPAAEPAVKKSTKRKGRTKLTVIENGEPVQEIMREEEAPVSPEPMFEQPAMRQAANKPVRVSGQRGEAKLFIERSDEFERGGIQEYPEGNPRRRRQTFTQEEAENEFLYGINGQPPVQKTTAYEKPVYETYGQGAQPVYEEPAYEPDYEAAADQEPAYDAPVYEQPAASEPAYDEPAYDESAAQVDEPVYEEPEQPVYEAPARRARPAAVHAPDEGFTPFSAASYTPISAAEEESGSVPSSIPAKGWSRGERAGRNRDDADSPSERPSADWAPMRSIRPEELRPAGTPMKARQQDQTIVQLRGNRLDGTPIVMPAKDAHEAPQVIREEYNYPPIDLLNPGKTTQDPNLNAKIEAGSRKLLATLESFGVQAKLTHVTHGPAITRYELQPAPGVKVSRIVNLVDDIALNMASDGVRIEAPIPGKPAVGIEIPNDKIEAVSLRDVLESPEMARQKSPTAVALGKGISGAPVVADMAKMPHVLIAGATGSGKSVCINTIINSIIYRANPNEVKLILIDPKVVELSVYNGIPHLLVPVVTDPKKASAALSWAVIEMEHRYKRFETMGVRNIEGYNNAIGPDEEKMSKIIVIIDELADLMMVAPGEVEESICRLAQLARAAGIHLVIATQRPSVNVITGVIKANIPSRIAFAVSSQIDSRTILDAGGAEKLLGRGDMLYAPQGAGKPTRVQGCFVSDDEVQRIVDFVRGRHEASYNEDVIEQMNAAGEEEKAAAGEAPSGGEPVDEMLAKAIELAIDAGQVSISMLQRRLRVGYARAGRLVDEMTLRGIAGEAEGPTKPRTVLITREEWRRMQENQE